MLLYTKSPMQDFVIDQVNFLKIISKNPIS